MPISFAPQDIARLLPAGARVYIQAGIAQPTTLLEALRADGGGDQHFVTAFFPGINEFALHQLGPRTRSTVFYASRSLAAGLASGQVSQLPLHQSQIAPYLADDAPPEVLLIQVSPPDARGQCSLGGGADFVPLLIDRARLVVAEVNEQLTRVADGPGVPWSRLTHVCQTSRPMPQFEDPAIDEVSLVVARRAAELVDDGDCVQAGIGNLPSALLAQLGTRRRLGVHSGIVGDTMAQLIESGAVTGEHKPRQHPRAVTTYLAGTGRIYALAERGAVAVRTPVFTHDAAVMAEIHNFVSVGAALEVDLLGQVNAEHLAGRAISGCGGFVDFVRGSRLSRGGRSIVMLQSTNRERSQSRIQISLAPGTPVTCARTDVDIVVTEHGVAHLRHLSVQARAERLIEIADPAFREDLARQWEALQRR